MEIRAPPNQIPSLLRANPNRIPSNPTIQTQAKKRKKKKEKNTFRNQPNIDNRTKPTQNKRNTVMYNS